MVALGLAMAVASRPIALRLSVLTLLDDERLLRVRELRCLHRFPLLFPAKEMARKTLTHFEGILGRQTCSRFLNRNAIPARLEANVAIELFQKISAGETICSRERRAKLQLVCRRNFDVSAP